MSDDVEELIQVRHDGEIAVVCLNNPGRMNAFSVRMRERLYSQLLEIEQREECRALVLAGAGGNFCAGGDISEMKRRSVLEGRLRMDLPTRIFKLLVAGPKPFIAAVEGNAAGAGLSLVAASDYCVAAADAQFSCAFMKMGLIPDVGGIWSLPRKIGQRRTMELCALAESFGAETALRMDLINKVCEPGKALEEAIGVARRFAKHPPVAMALLKSALAIGSDTLDQATNTEIAQQGVLMHTEDYEEAVRAFHDKRKPSFNGN
jgi:enoyl-CoA hydratase/carnithine racemase